MQKNRNQVFFFKVDYKKEVLQIRFIGTLICLCVISGWFCAILADFSSWERNKVKTPYYLPLYRKVYWDAGTGGLLGGDWVLPGSPAWLEEEGQTPRTSWPCTCRSVRTCSTSSGPWTLRWPLAGRCCRAQEEHHGEDCRDARCGGHKGVQAGAYGCDVRWVHLVTPTP